MTPCLSKAWAAFGGCDKPGLSPEGPPGGRLAREDERPSTRLLRDQDDHV
jgi:hypothetical protein